MKKSVEFIGLAGPNTLRAEPAKIPPRWFPRSAGDGSISVETFVPYTRTPEQDAIAERLGIGPAVIQGHFILRVPGFAPMRCALHAIERGPRFVSLCPEYYSDTIGLESGATHYRRMLSYC
jgi:hypothetical protein